MSALLAGSWAYSLRSCGRIAIRPYSSFTWIVIRPYSFCQPSPREGSCTTKPGWVGSAGVIEVEDGFGDALLLVGSQVVVEREAEERGGVALGPGEGTAIVA